MSEYWVSQGRRMCTYCKCWTADNKASINFHEQGKNHKENVIRKLDELRKKGVEDARRRETESSDLAKIDKAAMEAFKRDLKENPSASGAYGIDIEAKVSAIASASTKSDTVDKKQADSVQTENSSVDGNGWTTAHTEDGHLYYWNSLTGETSWYPPDNDYTSNSEKVEDIPEPAAAPKPPRPAKRSATTGFGKWETVQCDEPVVADYDLPMDSKNMPTLPEDIPLPPEAVVNITTEESEPQKKFKVKEVTLGSNTKDAGPVAFKKRKIGKQRQTRGKLEED